MKKKLFSFLMMLSVSIGAWAAEFTWTSSDGVYTVTATVNGDNTQVLTVNEAGALDAFVEATKTLEGNSLNGVGGNSARTKLTISGPMNAADMASMSSTVAERWGTFTTVDMSGVEFSSTNASAFCMDGAEFVLFPSGTTTTQMSALSGLSNLKTAGAVTTSSDVTLPYTKTDNEYNAATGDEKVYVSDRTYSTFNELAVYSYKQNYVDDFSTTFDLGDASLNKLSMAGLCGTQDLYNGTSRNFTCTDLHYFDFTGATFDDITISLESTNSYGGTSNATGGIEGSSKVSCTSTNALYYLCNYNVMTCVLPTGNTEIPPHTFYTNNAGWTSPISSITIPSGYTSIGFEAFTGSHISSLYLPGTIQNVGEGAFGTSTILEKVEMEGITDKNVGCTFGFGCFGSCKELKFISLSEGVKNIAGRMFYQCLKLESVRIPTTCESIGINAFEECYSLHTLTLPEPSGNTMTIENNAFHLTGITDLYIMAKSPDKVPKIYSLGCNGIGVGPATFTPQRVNGNGTAPTSMIGEIRSAHYDEVCSWYQEYQSGKTVGTQNCLVNIHYPDNMKLFYEGVNLSDMNDAYTAAVMAEIPGACDKTVWSEYVTTSGHWAAGAVAVKLDANLEGDLEKYMPNLYSVTQYSWDQKMGPDADGRYYPMPSDYIMRLAAGSQNGNSVGNTPSAWGWRQYPLAMSVGDMGEEEYDKDYDDTWYTMCFPWKMTDNQLFDAFNQKCEIVEFVGAEVLPAVEGSTTEFNLVFHFDKVAVTSYMDDNDVEYSRAPDMDTDGNQKLDNVGNKLYIYTSKDGNNTVVQCPTWSGDLSGQSATVKEAYAKYMSIKNILAKAGHPYMIHPSIGAAPGTPASVVFTGIKKVEVGEGKAYASYEALAEGNKVEKTVTSNKKNEHSTTAWTNPLTGGGGKYTFIGNNNDAVETDGVSDNGVQNMPLPCYFLGVSSSDRYYPRYYRKQTGGVGKWSQYSAIIIPDDDAKTNVEPYFVSASGSSSSSAKSASIIFGEYDFDEMEETDEMGIATIIDNAVEKEKSSEVIRIDVVYNINGQIVRADSGSVEGLPKGIYIVNGKKYMVK